METLKDDVIEIIERLKKVRDTALSEYTLHTSIDAIGMISYLYMKYEEERSKHE